MKRILNDITESIRIDELITFSSNKTIDGKLCITKQKAISIVNNPCADNKDVALMTAWDNTESHS